MTPSGLDASGPLCSEVPSSPDTTGGAGKHTQRPRWSGLHARGGGPGDSFSLPYFAVDDLAGALEQVEALGGSVVHPGSASAVCKDSEGSPFGLTLVSRG
jgi:predicted enzyme related to lactoylglutathione lyase